jgi:8-oxo-dGTP diphosphatase
MAVSAQAAAPAERTRLEPPATAADREGRATPEVDLRVVLFTVADGRLLVALPDGTGTQLPRGLPTPHEPLDSAARRIVQEATGVREQYLEQLYTLSVREAPAWTIIVSYMGLVCSAPGPVQPPSGIWHDVADLPSSLSAADRMVAGYALVRLRAKLGYTNIAFHLLPERFTLSELQETYETILARRLDKRNFRRRVIASGILLETDEKRREGSHRPATLYRFRPADDRETYLTPPWAEGA